jgi:hypothetical protein
MLTLELDSIRLLSWEEGQRFWRRWWREESK